MSLAFTQSNQPVLIPNDAYTVSVTDSGKLLLSGAITANRTINLPPVQIGLHYRFMDTATAAFTATIQPRNVDGTVANGLINGVLINQGVTAITLAGALKNAANTVIFTIASVLGDYVDLYCDGVSWHV